MELKVETHKRISRAPVKCTYLISSFWLNSEGSYARKSTFSRTKRGEIPISLLLIDLRGWFFDTIYNYRFSIDWLKKGQNLRF